jgi:hypothetical protein
MYADSAATLRPDLNMFVEEATRAEQFYIAQSVFPPVMVPTKTGEYPRFKKGKAELLNNDVSIRTPGGSYGRVTRAYETDNYACVDRGLEELVDDTFASDVSRFFAAEQKAADWVRRQIALDLEIRVAAELFNTTNFGSAVNSSTAYTVANKATADFASDVLTAIDTLNARGEVPNTIVMSGPVLTRIKGQTLFQNFIRGNRPSDITQNLTPSAIASAFADQGIKQVLIGRAIKNGAKKGQAFSSSAVWSNTYVWIGRVEGGEMMAGGAGRTLVWNQEGGLFVTESYREEARRSNVVRVRQNTDEKAIDGESGYLLATQYS